MANAASKMPSTRERTKAPPTRRLAPTLTRSPFQGAPAAPIMPQSGKAPFPAHSMQNAAAFNLRFLGAWVVAAFR